MQVRLRPGIEDSSICTPGRSRNSSAIDEPPPALDLLAGDHASALCEKQVRSVYFRHLSKRSCRLRVEEVKEDLLSPGLLAKIRASVEKTGGLLKRAIAYFGENLPASTLVEVKGLVDPRMKVEIECQAYVE